MHTNLIPEYILGLVQGHVFLVRGKLYSKLLNLILASPYFCAIRTSYSMHARHIKQIGHEQGMVVNPARSQINYFVFFPVPVRA